MEIRPVTPDDEPAILELVSRSLGSGTVPRTREYWRWKHLQNPFGPSPGLSAWEDGQLIGLRMFLRWEWVSAHVTLRAVRAVDTATAPEARGRGVFTTLTQELVKIMTDEGVAFVFNTPNDTSRAGYLKMGWYDVARVPVMIKPLKPVAFVRGLLTKNRGGDRVTPELEPEQNGDFSEPLDDAGTSRVFDDALDGDRRFQTHVTADFVRWRYERVPGIRYRAHSRKDGNSSASIIFRHRERRGMVELSVSEVFVSHDDESIHIASDLLRDALRSSSADYAACIAVRGTAQRRAFVKAGFVPVTVRGPRFTVRMLDGSLDPNPLLWTSWRPSLGDLELF